jgi:hypothetical protein
MARKAKPAETHLIHDELAGLYAAHPEFSARAARQGTGVERPMLHLRHGGSNPPGPFSAPLHGLRVRPAANAGSRGGRHLGAESGS